MTTMRDIYLLERVRKSLKGFRIGGYKINEINIYSDTITIGLIKITKKQGEKE